jgi:hypothetical protein
MIAPLMTTVNFMHNCVFGIYYINLNHTVHGMVLSGGRGRGKRRNEELGENRKGQKRMEGLKEGRKGKRNTSSRPFAKSWIRQCQ